MERRNKAVRSRLIVAAATAAALALTGCTSSGPEGVEAQPVSTNITDEPVTITIAYVDDPPAAGLIEAFTDKYPNVTVDAQKTPYGDYVKSIPRSMDSNSAPDIVQYYPGPMRALIPASLVLNLDPYREAYNWDESFPASGLEVLTTNEKAEQYGTGSLYAVPGGMSVFGVFYNKTLLEQVGITDLPATLSDFDADLAEIQKAGVSPLSIGALGVGTYQAWSALVNVLGDPQDHRDWVFGAPGATIEVDGAKKATAKIVEWIDKGYIPEGASAIADTDSLADFVNGKGAFLITGNWSAAALEEGMGDNVGFFPIPATSAGADKVAPGASVAYSIAAKSKNPNVAAAFLNFMSSPEAAQIQFSGGFMPVNTKAEISADGLRGEIATGFAEIVAGSGIVPFPGFASPGMPDKLVAGVQGLVTGQMSQEDFLNSLQAEWTEFHG
jgi:raffinose/stachyose/melibiose transport system substrate-binding protein